MRARRSEPRKWRRSQLLTGLFVSVAILGIGSGIAAGAIWHSVWMGILVGLVLAVAWAMPWLAILRRTSET